MEVVKTVVLLTLLTLLFVFIGAWLVERKGCS